MTLTTVIAILFSYLLGSIPFGLLLTRTAGLGDIRSIGSGNIGATNVLRTGHKKLAAATLLLDGLKGAVAVIVVRSVTPDSVEISALAALLGHIFPVWLSFKGGKGVATGIGVTLGLAWPAGLIMMVMWAGMAKRFHISSLSALVAFAFAPLDFMMAGRTDLSLFALLITALIFWTHRDNIRRLMNHTEPHIGRGKDH